MKNEFRYHIDEIENAVYEIQEAIERLENVKDEVAVYDTRLSTILEVYIIAKLNSVIEGNTPTEFSLSSVTKDLLEYAEGEEWLQKQEEIEIEKTTEVVKDSIDDFNDALGYKVATLDQILDLEGLEGLVCIGAGGEITEWLDGVNGILKEKGVTSQDNYFNLEELVLFMEGNIRCILFPFRDTLEDFDVTRLAIVRLAYGDWMKWLSDYQDIYNGEADDNYDC